MYECDYVECDREFESQRGLTQHKRQTHDVDKPWTDRDVLRKLYHEKGMNQTQIADELGTTAVTICEWMEKLNVEARSNSEAKLNELPEEPWRDENVLNRLYSEEKMSLREIADHLGCGNTVVEKWMDRFGIESRDRKAAKRLGPASFRTSSTGYEVWSIPDCHDIGVHRLVAIADGADPKKVFSGEYHVHHENEIPWDNRPENLRLLTVSEHRSLHAKKRMKDPNDNFKP